MIAFPFIQIYNNVNTVAFSNKYTELRENLSPVQSFHQIAMEILLSEIVPNPHQIRKIEENEELRELAESIKEHGLLQPIKVKPIKVGYQLIYGHRRVYAMRLLGWEKCEAIVEVVNDEESLLQSLAENLQRENLDILEEAQSYQTLIDRGYTIKDISVMVDKPQGRISNRLSILRLPREVQELVKSRKGQHLTTTEIGGISPDSASRIASSVKTPLEAVKIANKAIYENLNSRDIRELTALLKETLTPDERSRIINDPWRNHQGSDGYQKTTIESIPYNGSPPELLGDLFHKKNIWNIKKLNITSFNHFTIGYSARTIDQFLELLQIAQIDLLVDVRSVPISRFKSEFSRVNLNTVLTKNGFGYLHLPRLGVPSEIRIKSDKNMLFKWYDENVNIMEELNSLTLEINHRRLAFMCVEIDPQSCHRHKISNYLERIGFRLYDL